MLARSATASTILGYLSLGSWLGAQFPQVIENARRQSVDGLALSFLANWFFGDATNLIGCILTDRLPFQTMVATYFCLVDLCLLGQYVYYTQRHFPERGLESPQLTPTDESPSITPTASNATITNASRRRRRSISEISGIPTLHRLSIASTNGTVAANAEFPTHSAEGVQMDSPTPFYHARSRSRSTILYEHPEEYEEQVLTPSASDVASPTCPAAAETTDPYFPLARGRSVEHEEKEARSTIPGPSTQRNKRNVSWDPGSTTWPRRKMAASQNAQPDSVPRRREPLPRTSAEAFWSNILSSPQPQAEVDLERGRSRLRGQYEAPSRVRPVQEASVGVAADVGDRAQPLETEPLAHYPASTVVHRSQSPVTSIRRNSRKRATAPIVLFGAWLLFSLGDSSTQVNRSPQRPRLPPGVIIQRLPPMYSTLNDPPTPSFLSSSLVPSPEPSAYSPPEVVVNYNCTKEQFRGLELEEPSMKRIIGRISAWLCTTLYLTSRLPQIWKNYTRRSVEGLTMSLFVCAFLGNTFYVASIMMNPVLDESPPISNAFLRESIPYILGSAGTLLFDVTIVMQSFLYRDRKPLDPPMSSGYLPPRSIGMGGSLSASGMLSRTSTMRSEQLRRTRGHSLSSTTRLGSTRRGTPSALLGRDDVPELEPLLLPDVVRVEDQIGTVPRYRSTSTFEWRCADPSSVGDMIDDTALS